MAQSPFKTDVLQIEPGASGTRSISRDSTTGGLRFVDPAVSSGLLLAELAGLQSIPGVVVVGSGGGAQYTSIQDALDTAPDVVLITPGTYTENLVISKDMTLVGLGHVQIVSASVDEPTIHIREIADSVPRKVTLRDLTIQHDADGGDCVHVDGSNTFAAGTVTVVTAPLVAGDEIIIGGVTLTGVGAARTPGSDDFNATLGSAAALAAEIEAAINDAANGFDALVTAEASGASIVLRAVTPGVGGNAITLAVTTTPAGGLTVSGVTLEGGGGLDSEVALHGVWIQDCSLIAAGVGAHQIRAESVNKVWVTGGTWEGSFSSSECLVSQTASFLVENVDWTNDFQIAYDVGEDAPALLTSQWGLLNCRRVNNLLINLVGEGSTLLSHCPIVGNLTQGGDRFLTAIGCVLGDVQVEDTVSARLVSCSRSALSATGTPTTAETTLVLNSVLVGAGSDSVVFDSPQPDTTYAVLVDVPSAGITANITSKTATGFTATFSAAVTGTVFYTILRQM